MKPLLTPYNHSLLKEKRSKKRKKKKMGENAWDLWLGPSISPQIITLNINYFGLDKPDHLNLRNRQLNGIRFKRQYSVEFFIIDFYAPSLRLGIELDGGQHDNPRIRAQDRLRTTILNSVDIQILRFWNSEVYENLNEVLEEISGVCQSLIPHVRYSHLL